MVPGILCQLAPFTCIKLTLATAVFTSESITTLKAPRRLHLTLGALFHLLVCPCLTDARIP